MTELTNERWQELEDHQNELALSCYYERLDLHDTKPTTTVCVSCNSRLQLDVQKSVSGYYIGFLCSNCGPYSRESGYFSQRKEAEKTLNSGLFGRFGR